MRRLPGLLTALALAGGLGLAFAAPARADLLITVDKSTQSMTVTVDGAPRYIWSVSTGREGLNTPSGSFKPFRMDKDHFSRQYDDAPMPYAIFFTMHGDAIHGTDEIEHIGRAVSHGCVRLTPAHAAILWRLVKAEGMQHTRVVLSGHIPPRGVVVARRTPANDEAAAAPANAQDNGPDITGSIPQPAPKLQRFTRGGRVYYYGPYRQVRRAPRAYRYYYRRYYYGPPGW
jgi:hypothetical protein